MASEPSGSELVLGCLVLGVLLVLSSLAWAGLSGLAWRLFSWVAGLGEVGAG